MLTFLWAIRSFLSVNYTKWLAVLIENSGASVCAGNGVECFHAPSRRESSGCWPSVRARWNKAPHALPAVGGALYQQFRKDQGGSPQQSTNSLQSYGP